MAGRHQVQTSRWKRKIFGVPVGWLLALIVGAGVAIAAMVFSFNVTGTVSLADYGLEIQTVDYSSETIANGDCTATITGGGSGLDVTWNNARKIDAGSSENQCAILLGVVSAGNSETVYLADFLSGDPNIGITHAPIGGQLDCQDGIAPGTATPVEFYMVLEVDPGAPDGATLDLTGTEIQWSDVPEGDCDSSTA